MSVIVRQCVDVLCEYVFLYVCGCFRVLLRWRFIVDLFVRVGVWVGGGGESNTINAQIYVCITNDVGITRTCMQLCRRPNLNGCLNELGVYVTSTFPNSPLSL